MTDLLLSLFRIGFLLALWWFVFTVVTVLRRDLQAPREAKPMTPARRTSLPSPRPTLRSKKASTRLVITEGPLQGTVFPLTGSAITIGRAPEVTVVLDDDFVSSHHARLMPRGAQWIVEDLGSTNGTWVNDSKVAAPVVVAPGATVRIGRTSMELGHE